MLLKKPKTIIVNLTDKLNETSVQLINQEALISEERKALLDELSIYISGKLKARHLVDLLFICTHNSRRSHMAQLWAKAASEYYNIKGISTYSGGTQVTAFNKNAVNALRKSGFKITLEKDGNNPKYNVQYAKGGIPLVCYSKHYDNKKNPQAEFVAVMTCSHADESCPVISGAYYRTTISYEDPKKFDGYAQVESAYEQTSAEIGREMFYVFKKVAVILGIA